MLVLFAISPLKIIQALVRIFQIFLSAGNFYNGLCTIKKNMVDGQCSGSMYQGHSKFKQE